jgi:hypothetical protein
VAQYRQSGVERCEFERSRESVGPAGPMNADTLPNLDLLRSELTLVSFAVASQ